MGTSSYPGSDITSNPKLEVLGPDPEIDLNLNKNSSKKLAI
jgi:hypothetical protein